MSDTLSSAFADTKPHYNILDGLRGVAALTVVCFHLFEAYATSHLDQKINHGYLAVDFFFILSGFVVGYAYDDRWKTMRITDFLKRRFIRLHPMVVLGAVIGAVMFYFQGCSVWDVSQVSAMALIRYANECFSNSGDSRYGNSGSRRDVPSERTQLVSVF